MVPGKPSEKGRAVVKPLVCIEGNECLGLTECRVCRRQGFPRPRVATLLGNGSTLRAIPLIFVSSSATYDLLVSLIWFGFSSAASFISSGEGK